MKALIIAFLLTLTGCMCTGDTIEEYTCGSGVPLEEPEQ